MKAIPVLAARLGAQRLPRKPLLEVGGRTLLARAIDAARTSAIFDRVMVITEDEAIAAAARAEGAEVILRIPRPGDPPATSASLSLEVAQQMGGRDEDAVVNLQPTAPFRRGEDIIAAWRTFLDTGSDFLLSVSPIDPHFFHWALVEKDETWHPLFGDRYLRPGAEMTRVHRPDGAIKIARIGPLRAIGHFFGAPLAVHPLPPHRGLFVGTPEDIEVARALVGRAGLT